MFVCKVGGVYVKGEQCMCVQDEQYLCVEGEQCVCVCVGRSVGAEGEVSVWVLLCKGTVHGG